MNLDYQDTKRIRIQGFPDRICRIDRDNRRDCVFMISLSSIIAKTHWLDSRSVCDMSKYHDGITL